MVIKQRVTNKPLVSLTFYQAKITWRIWARNSSLTCHQAKRLVIAIDAISPLLIK